MPQVEPLGKPEERVLVDETGAQARELTLRHVWIAAEQRRGDHAVEYRIADELQSLVVGGAKAAMSQGLLQQLRAKEDMAQRIAGFERHRYAYFVAVASNSSSKLTLPTRWSTFCQFAVATSWLPSLVTSTSDPRTESM